MLQLYNFILWCYGLGIRLAAPFHVKAKEWILGRQEVIPKLRQARRKWTDPVVWMHAASLGEFEQGRPIIEQLKKDYPGVKIVLTFFSPSGYMVRKDYALADWVTYLPMDSRKRAKQFIDALQPQLVIFIKYDLWYHYLRTLQRAKIPTLLISALFRRDQFFFRSYGQWFLPAVADIDHIFVQEEESRQILLERGIIQVSTAGDSRVDRVSALAAQRIKNDILEIFADGQPILICGSTWPEDEAVLLPYINASTSDWKYMIAPHDIRPSRIAEIEKQLTKPTLRYSQAKNEKPESFSVLIIDNIGLLATLYSYGKIAYIGGAFGKGLHNTLEPITFGLPVIFGPRYRKFEEAKWLVENGGGFSVRSLREFQERMHTLAPPEQYLRHGQIAQSYIENHKGATQKIMAFIREQRYLVSHDYE